MYAAGERVIKAAGGVSGGDPVVAADLRAARDGDTAAMERLLVPHESLLLALCLSQLGNRADAEDAVQETFFRALQSLSRFRGEAKFSTYLAGIALRVCADQRRKRRPTLRLEEWGEGGAESPELPASATTTEQAVVDRVVAWEALRTLKPERRAALVLREREGWSLEEIGAAMGWSVSRVKVELYRARVALAAWFRRAENG
jgi:RNA polymerase sigma-70 factor, ECF subfamily